MQDFQTFEPQLNPFVAVAALAAAVPPVLFWGRVFMNAQRRIKEDEQKEEERQVSLTECSLPSLSHGSLSTGVYIYPREVRVD